MASVLSTYLGNKLLRWLLGNAMPSAPAALYLAIFNGDPKGAGAEVTTTVRAAGRVAITFGAVADNGTTVILANSADVDFGTSAGDATATHMAVYDAASGGNLLASKALGSSQSIQTGAPVKVLTGNLAFNLGTGDLSPYLANKLARWLNGNAMPSAPSSLSLSLFNGDPKASGTETTTTVRAAGRLALDFDAVSVGTDNQMITDADADFGAAAGDATVSHLGVHDAASLGNLLFGRALASSQAVVTGAPVKVLSGDLTITIGT